MEQLRKYYLNMKQEQPQMHPDQLRSSLGFLTNLQTHLLNHQHPELQAKSTEAPQSPQDAPESTPNTKAQKVPVKKEEGSNPDFEAQVMTELQKLEQEVQQLLQGEAEEKAEEANEPKGTKETNEPNEPNGAE